eukprot:2859453-Pleurochrysis_carterae.AAC.1
MKASRSNRVGGGDKCHLKSVPTVHRTFDLGMAGAFDESTSREARLLEVRDDAYSGLLASVRGSPDPRAMKVSRSSRVGDEDKGHSKSMPIVQGSSDLGMTGVFDESPFCDARLQELKDDA